MLMSYSFVDLLKLKPIEEVVPDFKKTGIDPYIPTQH